MADKPHTPSRRAMLAGLAAAPVAGLPAMAAAAALDGKSEFQYALVRHKTAQASVEEYTSKKEDIPDVVLRAELAALAALAAAPCAGDAEFLIKLRYLFEHEIKVYCGVVNMSLECGSVLVAVEQQMGAIAGVRS